MPGNDFNEFMNNFQQFILIEHHFIVGVTYATPIFIGIYWLAFSLAFIMIDYMKESIDNRQLQTIIINLKNCMHYQANYEEVLMQMMNQVAAGLTAREDRKNVLFEMKLTLAVRDAWKYVLKYHVKLPQDFIEHVMSDEGTAFLEKARQNKDSWYQQVEEIEEGNSHINLLPRDGGDVSLEDF